MTESCKVVPRTLSRSPRPVEVSGFDSSDRGRSFVPVAGKRGTAHRFITAFTQRSKSDNGIKPGGSFLQISGTVAEKKRSASETIPRVRRASTRVVGMTSEDNDDSRIVVWVDIVRILDSGGNFRLESSLEISQNKISEGRCVN